MNPQTKQDLDNLARLQQMKLNTRLTALQAAQAVMSLPSYENKACHLTLMAMAADIEKYILGEIEAETEAALKKAKAQANVRPIMRP